MTKYPRIVGRRRFLLTSALLACLCFVFPAASSFGYGAGSVEYAHTNRIGPNLDYTNIVSYNEYGRQEAYVLELRPGGDILPIATDGGDVRGGSTINGAVNYAESLGYNVVAAVNADFFTVSTGVPMGVFVEDGVFVSSDDGHNSIAFYSDGTAFIGTPGISLNFENNTAGIHFTADHYNKTPSQYTFNLLSRDYVTDLNLPGTWNAAVLRETGGSMTVGGEKTYVVDDIMSFSDSYTIPDGCMILIAMSGKPSSERFGNMSVGDSLTLTVNSADARFNSAAWAIGCGDILIDGGITDPDGWDSAIYSRNPRTAAGIKSDGTLVLYTVDGRNSSHSNGLTLYQLAEELLDLGCVGAVNLDGGGSSAMSLKQHGDSRAEVINRPSGGSLRSCATYIILAAQNSSDGIAKNLFLDNDGLVALKRSLVPAGKILATDGGYSAASPPQDVSITSDEAEYQNGAFRLGSSTGQIRIYLSSGPAEGMGEFFVPENVSSLSISSDPSDRNAITIREGESFQLYVDAEYGAYDLIYSPESFEYSVSPGIGSVSSSGLVQSGRLSAGTGSASASYGNKSSAVTVYVKPVFSDISSHWAAEYIDQLGENGIAAGETIDGSRYYLPESSITREEFFTMLANSMGLDSAGYDSVSLPFEDTEAISSWAVGSIKALYGCGVLSGSYDGGLLYANPADHITRQEAFFVITRAFGGEADSSVLSEFSDGYQVESWAAGGVAALITSGIVEGYEDGTIRPYGELTRAETAKLFASYL